MNATAIQTPHHLFCAILLLVISALPFTAQAQDTDSDGDGLSDQFETATLHTDPMRADSDGDGISDGDEFHAGQSPHWADKRLMRQSDLDSDGAWDDWELAIGTNLIVADTDADGFNDGNEILTGFSPTSTHPVAVPKLIHIGLQQQQLTYTFGGITLDQFKISSGLWRTPTPIGNYSVLVKRPIVDYRGSNYDYSNTKWNLMFKRSYAGNYYIHSAWWHNKFGQPMSHGCINVPPSYEYMGRLYDWAATSTSVSITK